MFMPMAAWGGPSVDQQSEDDMKELKKTEHLAGLSARVIRETKYTIWCERKNLGCQTTEIRHQPGDHSGAGRSCLLPRRLARS